MEYHVCRERGFVLQPPQTAGIPNGVDVGAYSRASRYLVRLKAFQGVDRLSLGRQLVLLAQLSIDMSLPLHPTKDTGKHLDRGGTPGCAASWNGALSALAITQSYPEGGGENEFGRKTPNGVSRMLKAVSLISMQPLMRPWASLTMLMPPMDLLESFRA